MDIFVARQPIFTKNKETYGYELLFRDGLKNAFPNIDGSTATTKVLSNTFFSIGIDEITGNRPGLINFTKELILNNTPLAFPKNAIIIEILENVEPDNNIIESIKAIKKQGYTIALDDFIFDKKYLALLNLTDIIKFDLIATPLESIRKLIESIKKKYPKIILLAEKVETYEEFQKAKDMGFTLFQGYFFSKPEIISKQDIPSNKISLLRLASEVNKTEIDSNKLINFIKNDVAVSYKMLKFINSAYFNRPNDINTIKDAVAFLGLSEVKKFINIIAAAGVTEDKPPELLRHAVIRGRMCELIGKEFETNFNPDEFFTIGLFSLMDAMLDKNMEDIFQNISFSKRIKDALLGKNLTFNYIMQGVTCFETGDWTKCKYIRESSKKIYDKLSQFHIDAIKMAETLN